MPAGEPFLYDMSFGSWTLDELADVESHYGVEQLPDDSRVVFILVGRRQQTGCVV